MDFIVLSPKEQLCMEWNHIFDMTPDFELLFPIHKFECQRCYSLFELKENILIDIEERLPDIKLNENKT